MGVLIECMGPCPDPGTAAPWVVLGAHVFIIVLLRFGTWLASAVANRRHAAADMAADVGHRLHIDPSAAVTNMRHTAAGMAANVRHGLHMEPSPTRVRVEPDLPYRPTPPSRLLKRMSSSAVDTCHLASASLDQSLRKVSTSTEWADFKAFKKDCAGTGKQTSFFTSHVRSEENFNRGNMDPETVRPPRQTTLMYKFPINRKLLYRYLFLTSDRREEFIFCLLLANVGAALALICAMASYHGETHDNALILVTLDALHSWADDCLNGYKFYPMLLLIGYMGVETKKWIDLVRKACYVQGRLHDIVMSVGTSVVNPDDPETRAFLYRVFRYLNVAHSMCYKDLSKNLKELTIPGAYVRLGLLTEHEWNILEPAKNKMRDTCCAWIGHEIQVAVRAGMLNGPGACNYQYVAMRLRGYMGDLHDTFEFVQPNTWIAYMVLSLDILIGLFILSGAFAHFLPFTCFQYPVLIGVIFLTLPFLGSEDLISVVRTPFDKGDELNADWLISNSENTCFSCLRVAFDQRTFKRTPFTDQTQHTPPDAPDDSARHALVLPPPCALPPPPHEYTPQVPEAAAAAAAWSQTSPPHAAATVTANVHRV
jgi:hypothetical protein